MTFIHVTEVRDYEKEWEHIRNMDMLSSIRMPYHVIVFGDNAKAVGLHMLFLGECDNDN